MSDGGETSIDHITALPDSILHHILSLLTAKDVFKTSVLSKRWRSLSAEFPVLPFSDKTTPCFESFISETLANYSGNKVKRLDISFRYASPSSWLVDEWIRFAIELKVEELNLLMGPKIGSPRKPYRLLQSIYSNSSLQMLDTSWCHFEPSVGVSWTSLKVLTLYHARLSNDAIATILLGSPNLEYLKMFAFEGVDKFTVTCSNLKLKSLVLQTWRTPTIEISAPHIHSLCLTHDLMQPRMIIKLIDLSSLVELNLDFIWGGYESMIVIVGELHRLQTLIATSASLKLLSTGQMLSSPSPLLLKCESLSAYLSFKQWDLLKIVTLLQTTPYVKRLYIFMDHSSRYEFDDNSQYWESMKTEVKCDHLKAVVITGFEQSWCIGSRLKLFTSMVEFLLKTAMVLEEMIIFGQSKLPDLSEVNNLISSYPRASLVEFRTSWV